jgi:fatty acid desaturase
MTFINRSSILLFRRGSADVPGLRSTWRRAEGPTWALAAAIYGAWALLLATHEAFAAPLWIALAAWVIAWQTSLQHETIHGHPGGGKAAARLLGYPPLMLWLPYPIYRLSHLQHHNDARLTDPFDDPESYYESRRRWLRLPPPVRRVLLLNHTLAGRLLLGPAIVIGIFLWKELRLVAAGDRRRRRVWGKHAVGVAAIFSLAAMSGTPLENYLAAVYGATSLILLRSYYEHRAAREPAARTAIVEAGLPLALLFLFNNLHAAHHASPRLPWYELPGFYRANRASLLAQNGGFHFRGYGDLFRKYLLRPNYLPIHPTR